MKTIELDLEKDQELENLSSLIKNSNIKVGEEVFNIRFFISHAIGDTFYAGFLLLLTKYFSKLIEESKTISKADLIYFDKASERFYLFYLKNFDIHKLKNKIEKDFKLKIEVQKKNPLDAVFGIWKDEKITLEQIRDNAWRRNN